MTTITEMILTPAMPLDTPVRGIDFDPEAGSGAMLDEIDAPEGYSESTIAYDPWI